MARNRDWRRSVRCVAASLTVCYGLLVALPAVAQQLDIVGPAGSGHFGKSVVALPNGNIVVTDPDFGGVNEKGAVYLYSPTGTLISALTGTINCKVGNGGVVVLKNGNFVIRSTQWNDTVGANLGAVTWVNGSTGLSGVVSAANSLVGSTAGDSVGLYGVYALANGNYVVASANWSNGAAAYAGAVTWANGSTGLSGVVSAANSLVGTNANDQVGVGDNYNNASVTPLSSGNYVVTSPYWKNGAAALAGAVTWVNGSTGLVGPVSAANSLVGTTANDQVGSGGNSIAGVTVLGNGNYLVASSYWNNGAATTAGAVTWVNGSTGLVGAVSVANSLVGATAANNLGSNGSVTELTNGNYVVCDGSVANGAVTNAGVATWGNGSAGVSGPISAANSLIGTNNNDYVCWGGVTALSNGNYVVNSFKWTNATTAGAVTWGSGSAGVTGAISVSNSLIGAAGDQVGYGGVRPLTNGNYVISSPYWSNGPTVNVGAVTWANGSTGLSGTVSVSNSLIGAVAGDVVGASNNGFGYSGSVTALSNGNYVVASTFFHNGPAAGAGAVTWANGTTGLVGVVSSSNSLVGSTTGDYVGGGYGAPTYFTGGITALSNGNYVVASPYWANSGAMRAGAATWGDGTSALIGVVSATNSLVGTTTDDSVGGRNSCYCEGVRALSNGNYVVASSNWSNGAATNAGAVTWANGSTGLSGTVSAANSLVGSAANDHVGNGDAYDGNSFPSVTELANGNYVVLSTEWANGAAAAAGAVTWADGSTGVSGPVSAANSLVGSTTNDEIGNGDGQYYGDVTTLINGDYLVGSSYWTNGATPTTGAITFGLGSGGTTGTIRATNSVRGVTSGGGTGMVYATTYDAVRDHLIVGQPSSNIVSLFGPDLLTSGTDYVPALPLPPPPASSISAGSSVAVAPGFIVTGAPNAMVGGASSGQVYIYSGGSLAARAASATSAGNSKSGFVRKALADFNLATLQLPLPINGDKFGQGGVAINRTGTTVVVGAPGVNNNTGAVFVFRQPIGGWPTDGSPVLPSQTLVPVGAQPGDQVGTALIMTNAGTVLAGAPGATVSGLSGAGKVHVLRPKLDGSYNNSSQALSSSIPQVNANFGKSITGEGAELAVGAPGQTVNGLAGAGAVVTFREPSQGQPYNLRNLIASLSPALANKFGFSTSMSNGTLVVGAPGADQPAAPGAGAAVIYDESPTGSMDPIATLTDPAPTTGAALGTSVSISDQTVAAGAPMADVGGNTGQGAIAVYVPTTFDGSIGSGAIIPTGTLFNPDGSAGDQYGSSFVLSPDLAAAGAPDGTTAAAKRTRGKALADASPGEVLAYTPNRLFKDSLESIRGAIDGCASPNALIPDNDPTGITSEITLTGTGSIRQLDVEVRIAHSFVSELNLSLTHVPSNKTVPLYVASQSCASHDIDATFSDRAAKGFASTTCNPVDPAIDSVRIPKDWLIQFQGETRAGPWRLTVKDTAAPNTGTLQFWCVDVR